MIAPQELRLGNLTKDSRGKILTVLELLESYARVYTIRKEWWSSTSYDDLEPIELNEDWLFKLGYECNKNEYSISGHDRFNVFQSVKGPYIFCDDKIAIKYVKYVHELQNIFFALTGEELTIKETK
ncbi:hypothetical protein JOE44_001956 [Chryseobacterium sp. PvR013]|uniref:hypothetical protein n=1 Tax=Chryseobacterium sp. PvR013 TaxID=2806595 RepID=UPI001AE5F8A4|nr:hypothetical protein [Chryseobacterium sp. PvR013]MBP1165072.1 hypothetical protein [Chryseobacterium sp. PvR013]